MTFFCSGYCRERRRMVQIYNLFGKWRKIMTQILFESSLKVLAWVRAHMRSARYSRSLIQLSCCCPLPLYDEARAFGGGGGSPWHFPNRNRSPCRDVSSPETLPEVPSRGNLPFGKTSATEAPHTGCGERKCLLVVIFPSGKTSATEARQTGCGERRCFLVVIFLPAKHLPRRHRLWVRVRQVADAGVPNLGTSAS